MKQNKFEIGSQWKTREGGRAVIVGFDEGDNSYIAWHETLDVPRRHNSAGLVYGEGLRHNADLMEPWVELKKCTSTIYLVEREDGRAFLVTQFDYEMKVKSMGYRIIGKKTITITEGERMGVEHEYETAMHFSGKCEASDENNK